jgi:hypothetical protein
MSQEIHFLAVQQMCKKFVSQPAGGHYLTSHCVPGQVIGCVSVEVIGVEGTISPVMMLEP